MPQLRQNIITGEWVVIAPARSKRPDDYIRAQKREVKDELASACVFCLNGSEFKRRLKNFDNKHTWTIQNKFPAFACDEKECSDRTRSYYPEHQFYRAKAAVGEHDVIVVKDHETTLPKFTTQIWSDLIETIQLRMIEHHRNEVVNHIMPIYNHGPEAGASVAHPHAQIFSGPVIPNIINRELDGSQRYFENNGVCVFCDMTRHEKTEKLRLVAENDHFIAFTFFAARFPFEIWILPKKHQSNFERLSRTQRQALSEIMQNIFKRLDKLLANPSLNWWIHSLPTILDNSDSYHWHIEIAPRLTGYGGFEMGSGMVIDIQDPEESAEYLRKTKTTS